jgi:hypothetical protein
MLAQRPARTMFPYPETRVLCNSKPTSADGISIVAETEKPWRSSNQPLRAHRGYRPKAAQYILIDILPKKIVNLIHGRCAEEQERRSDQEDRHLQNKA